MVDNSNSTTVIDGLQPVVTLATKREWVCCGLVATALQNELLCACILVHNLVRVIYLLLSVRVLTASTVIS